MAANDLHEGEAVEGLSFVMDSPFEGVGVRVRSRLEEGNVIHLD